MSNDLNDFGFCFIDEDELEGPKAQIEEVKQTSSAEITSVKNTAFDALQTLQSLVLPLLLNLKKNPEKDIIKWPNRTPVIQSQIDKIEKIVDDYQKTI
tara:strand:+ start:379 stop:672 length:294 start_codon:yes stop_codon:yes gene_type:complete